MTITVDAPFVAAPRIRRATFVGVLERASSFAADALWAPTPPAERPALAGRLYDLIAASGHDPAVWLAICAQEHGYGTNRESVLWRCSTRSWTNARSVRDPSLRGWEIVRDPVRRSDYVRYATVEDSLRDGMYRISDPTYRYAREGRTSIGAVLAIWTEGDAAAYAAAVVRRIAGWQQQEDGPYGNVLPGLRDARHLLARRDPDDGVPAGPRARRPLAEKRGLVVHYSGPPVRDRADTLATLQAEARYHVAKDWAGPGEPPLHGDGLMYHVAIGDDGTAWLCRDLEDVLWHCGAWPQNALALSVHVPIGGEQRATTAQLATLRRLADAWCVASGTPRGEVWGHQELSPTSCPGTLMSDFIWPYREGKEQPVSDGHWFAETGHSVGGAFWRFWQARGGLPIFGYPLTEELQEDGRTVQYFERAVFEWHPENPDPYKVLLRRLGAAALAREEDR